MSADTDPTKRIKGVLLANPKGIEITEIAKKAGMHRSAAAKYLELLRASGQVEMRRAGMAKLYSLSHRIPLSDVLDLTGNIHILIDDRGRIMQVNESCEAFCGLHRDAIVGKSLEHSDIPLFSDPEISAMVRIIENQEVLIRSYTIPGEKKNLHFRIRLIPTVFERGGPGVAIIGVDITREQEILHHMFSVEKMYQATIDRFPNPVCVFSPDFSIRMTNNAFREWFGHPSEAIGNSSFLDMVFGAGPGQRDHVAQAITRNPFPFLHEQCVESYSREDHHEAESRWVRWHFDPEYKEDGALIKIQATGIEITREKGFERELAEKNRWIEFLSRKSLEFTEFSPETDMYGNICKGALEVVPDAVISHSSYDPATGSLTVRTIMGDHENIFGRYFPGSIGLSMPLTDPEALLMMRSRKLHPIPGGLHVATFGRIPPLLSSRIEEKIHWVSTWGICLANNEQLLSALVILKCSDGPVEQTETLEAYARVSSLALKKWLLEREKRASE